MANRPPPILPIEGVPDKLLQAINSRFRMLGGDGPQASTEETGGSIVTSVNTRTGAVVLTSSDVGLANLTNEKQVAQSAAVDLTSQNAAIPTTTLLAAASGLYQLDATLATRATGTAGTATLTISWNDGITARTSVAALPVSALNLSNLTISIYSAGGNITYGVGLSGVTGSPTYDLHIKLSR